VIVPALLLGLAVGSFLNVVIARLPEQRSLVRPRSSCPACGAAIAWHDNIPLLSFALLRGRCRVCGIRISWRYPLVEALTGALYAGAAAAFGSSIDFIVASALLAALVAITFIDLDHQIIPNAITYPGILAGLAASLLSPRISWLDSGLGVLVGGGIFFLIAEGSLRIMGQEGMGGGDVKLGAMLGAFLGWQAMLFTILLSVVGGGLVAGGLIASGLKDRKDPIPFGPFLAVAGAIGFFWGKQAVRWYLAVFV
jgi:leader peptidase (prepilin peptidase) / N-methyltransferase